jgi:DNA polymerase III subunit gamma/tau
MAEGHYLVLARKWRPQTFEEVVGQEHITRTIQNAIASNRIGHAFLFIGSRGIGKTTTARILAKALNCQAADGPTPNPCNKCPNCTAIAVGNSIDVVEIDGASNNSVDDVRQIRENIQLVPSSSRYKIYIIDEVHQLSGGAFNALLKTLEEPPSHAIFVLATTEAHKVPATIISRCQRYDFRRVGIESIITLLKRILDAENRKYSDEALYAIARAADGGIRDSESILEQVISFCGDDISYESVYEVLGLVEWGIMHRLCDAMIAKDIATQLQIVEDVVVSGKDLPQFIEEILTYFRNLLVCKTAEAEKLLALPDDEIAAMRERAEKFSLTELIRLVEQIAELFKRDFDQQLAPRIALESLLIRCSKIAVEVSLDTVLEKLAQLGAGGITVQGAASAAPAATAPPAPAKTRKKPARTESPPPDPPEPLPSNENTPAAEATPQKAVFTLNNAGRFWPRIQEACGVSLGIWIGHGIPKEIDGGTLVLRFAATQKQAANIADKPENRQILEAALCELTRNLNTFRCELAEPVEMDEASNGAAELPIAGAVNPEAARAALENPEIAKVIDVFKGRIVDVKTTVEIDPDGVAAEEVEPSV